MDAAEILRLRLRAQRLEPRLGGSAADVVRAVCGIQAQDERSAALSIRARSTGLTATAVERARVEERSIVRTWAWRGTLHLVAAEDLGWVLPLVAPAAIRGAAGRWRQLGLDERLYARAREVMASALRGGPLTRPELADRLAADGIDASGQRAPHLLRRAALEGLVCQGPGATYVLVEDWIGPVAAAPPGTAPAELGRRYCEAYGPADARDLAAWSGLPIGEARAAWAAGVEGAVVGGNRDGGEAGGNRDGGEADEAGETDEAGGADEAGEPSAAPVVRLLPSFDAYLLGYADRGLAVAPEHARRVHPGGGWLRAVLTVDGRVAGTWRLDRAEAIVDPFAPLAPAALLALEAERGDIARFLGGA